jgi:hypothetical protein
MFWYNTSMTQEVYSPENANAIPRRSLYEINSSLFSYFEMKDTHPSSAKLSVNKVPNGAIVPISTIQMSAQGSSV